MQADAGRGLVKAGDMRGAPVLRILILRPVFARVNICDMNTANGRTESFFWQQNKDCETSEKFNGLIYDTISLLEHVLFLALFCKLKTVSTIDLKMEKKIALFLKMVFAFPNRHDPCQSGHKLVWNDNYNN